MILALRDPSSAARPFNLYVSVITFELTIMVADDYDSPKPLVCLKSSQVQVSSESASMLLLALLEALWDVSYAADAFSLEGR